MHLHRRHGDQRLRLPGIDDPDQRQRRDDGYGLHGININASEAPARDGEERPGADGGAGRTRLDRRLLLQRERGRLDHRLPQWRLDPHGRRCSPVTAEAGHTVSSTTIAVTVGVLAGYGTSAKTTVNEDVEAYLGTQASASPSTSVTTYAPQGSITVSACTTDSGTSAADGGLAGPVGISGDIADATRRTDGESLRQRQYQSLTTPGDLQVTATAPTNSAMSNIVGDHR